MYWRMTRVSNHCAPRETRIYAREMMQDGSLVGFGDIKLLLEITGGGLSVTPEIIGKATRMTRKWIQGNKLRAEIKAAPWHDMERAWAWKDVHGRRLAIAP